MTNDDGVCKTCETLSQKWDSGTSTCVPCANTEVFYDGSCKACSQAEMVYDSGSQQCVTCEAKGLALHPTSRLCVPCENVEMVLDDGVCVTCESLGKTFDSGTQACVTCDTLGQYWFNGTSCEQCLTGTQLNAGKTACEVCGITEKEWDSNSLICVPCSKSQKVFQADQTANTGSCVTCESLGLTFNTSTSATNCVQCSEYQKYWNADASQCSDCSVKGMVWASTKCVPTPSTMYTAVGVATGASGRALQIALSDGTASYSSSVAVITDGYSFSWAYSQFPTSNTTITVTLSIVGAELTNNVQQLDTKDDDRSYDLETVVMTLKMYSVSGAINSAITDCSAIVVVATKANTNQLKTATAGANCQFTVSWLYSEYNTPASEIITLDVQAVLGYTSAVTSVAIGEATKVYTGKNIVLTPKSYTIAGAISGLPGSCANTVVKMTIGGFTSAAATLTSCDYLISWTYVDYAVPATATDVQVTATIAGYTSSGVTVSVQEATAAYTDKNVAFTVKPYTISGTITGLADCAGTVINMVKDAYTSADAVLTGCNFVVTWTFAQYATPSSGQVALTATKSGFVSAGATVSVATETLTYTGVYVSFSVYTYSFSITGTITGLPDCAGTVVKMVKDAFTTSAATLVSCVYIITWSNTDYLVPATTTVLSITATTEGYTSVGTTVSAIVTTVSYTQIDVVFTENTYTISGSLLSGPADCTGIVVTLTVGGSMKATQTLSTSTCTFQLSWLYSAYMIPYTDTNADLRAVISGYDQTSSIVINGNTLTLTRSIKFGQTACTNLEIYFLDGICQATCPVFYSGTDCVTACPPNAPLQFVSDGKTNCVATCPNSLFAGLDNICAATCANFYGFGPNGKQCQATCPSGFSRNVLKQV